MDDVAYMVASAIVSIVVAVIFGFVTKKINENKGYTGGFAWGFWLGIIGIIVVACKRDLNTYNPNPPGNPYNSGYNDAYRAQDAASQIARYKELLDSGAITEEEYEQMKRSLLRQMN